MFAERLRALRQGRNMTLTELARELSKMTPDERPNTGPQIGSWERGVNTPSYIEVHKLAVLFGVSMDYLAGRAYPQIDLNELFATTSQLEFAGQKLSSADRNAIYGLVKGYVQGKYFDPNGASGTALTDDLTLPLD